MNGAPLLNGNGPPGWLHETTRFAFYFLREKQRFFNICKRVNQTKNIKYEIRLTILRFRNRRKIKITYSEREFY